MTAQIGCILFLVWYGLWILAITWYGKNKDSDWDCWSARIIGGLMFAVGSPLIAAAVIAIVFALLAIVLTAFGVI